MKNSELKKFFQEDFFQGVKWKYVEGRYVTNRDLEKFRSHFQSIFKFEVLGKSVNAKPITRIKFGTGEIKVLAWSQMHGNEATTTKAIFDLLNTFQLKNNDSVIAEILANCSIYIIPVLNPDGAEAYTRVNANSVDLNRDLQDLSQPESSILMEQYNDIKPDFCLNLHDQRTIFSAGDIPEPATLSFLTPSKDKERSIDDARRQSMSLIAGMAEDLQGYLPRRIGRYDDAFNINCAGDTFQNLGTPTVLFEAGHYPGDYEREQTRKYVFQALLSCLHQISTVQPEKLGEELYFRIPENQKLFNDVVIRNAIIEGEQKEVAIQFKEVLKDYKVEFQPEIVEIANKISVFGHREIDAKGRRLILPDRSEFRENVIVNKILINNTELELKS